MLPSPAQPSASARALVKDALQLRDIFATVDESSCPRDCNFHTHTLYSDGQLSPSDLVEQAIKLGLREFAITDHHTVNGYQQAKQYLEDWQWRNPASIGSGRRQDRSGCLPRLWTGVEITSFLLNVEVHILGYAFNPAHDAIQPYLQGYSLKGNNQLAEKVIQAIQTAGGLAVLAHPCRYRRSPETLVAEAVDRGIDGIETYYAYDNPSFWRPCPKKTPLMQRLVKTFGILSTCGTDTHGKTITRRL